MNMISSRGQAADSGPLALHIIPPAQSQQDRINLEAAMQSLVLDKRHPLALELAGTAEQRSFIIRATTQSALDHAEALLRSQYPQLEVRPLREYEDPFCLASYEAASAVELVAARPAYLPLRTWQDEQGNGQETEGIDPLLGLLAALSKLPERTRAIAQIALEPAPPDWSRDSLRKAVEHPLEPERRAERLAYQRDMFLNRYSGEGISTPALISIGILFGLYWLARRWIPGWLLPALWQLAAGRNPHLSSLQILQIAGWGAGLALACVLLPFTVGWIRGLFFSRPIYNMRQVAQQTSRMAYRARIRLYVIGPRIRTYGAGEQPATRWEQLRAEREQAEERQEMLLRLVAAYRQFHQASGAYFVPRRITARETQLLLSRDPARNRYGWQRQLHRSKHLITVDALASLWHLPPASALPELALVEQRRARTMLIPPDLSRASAGLPPIGFSEHGGYRLPFALTPQFFTMHTLIAGKSGEGKSTCMEHIAREAIKQGGLILIDPHGDLCEHVLHQVPPERAEEVVLIDLSDTTASVGINPLDVTLGRSRDKAISDVLKTLAHIWATAWGPRMENAFEMSLRTLFEANKVLVAQDPLEGPRQQYTLLDVLPLLTNENFCHALLQSIEDDYLHRWWREYYEPLTLMQQRDVINPVITKVAKFESVIARRIIGQSVSTLNFSQMIAERKIILLKLAKGVIGADVAALIGATMLGLLQITLEEQGSLQEWGRVRLPIILDEFQTLAGVDYGALAELRKYGATFFLATQSLEYLQKLDEFLLPTVLANVKQMIIFHLSAQDAEIVCKDLGVEEEDILNLDMHTCYVKLSALNRRQPTFSLRVSPPPAGDSVQAESIRTRCRVRYSCPVADIDGRLRDAMIRALRLTPTPGSSRQAPRPAPSRDQDAPLVLPSLSLDGASPDDNTSPLAIEAIPHGAVKEARRRGKRGSRSSKRAEKYQMERQKKGEVAPTAFSEDNQDEDEDEEAELWEIQALRPDKEDDE